MATFVILTLIYFPHDGNLQLLIFASTFWEMKQIQNTFIGEEDAKIATAD